jgi:hypothetical protein
MEHSFRSIVSSKFAIKCANHVAWPFFVSFIVITCLVSMEIAQLDKIQWGICRCLVCSFITWVEMTRFDINLTRYLFKQFEYIYIQIWSIVQFAIFAVWSRRDAREERALNIYVWSLFCMGISMFDAAPTYKKRFKITLLILATINCIRIFVTNFFFSNTFVQFTICTLYCTTSEALAFSALFTLAVFYVKYILIFIFYPDQNRCLILKVSLLCKLVTFPLRRSVVDLVPDGQ